ncbi:hypothetical protein [Phenylobacterium montanum]|uniref:Uncharacterized protein n=1 Tax=Phenylobacterium montanum TaxID=2823693 RepID=A0A975G2I9_9CAUL|nr:hypothetical protein [Caulobacter sp. S6]QUD89599.1 hypothetical protein KCG34_06880 [Caulobacter sp. S6]
MAHRLGASGGVDRRVLFGGLLIGGLAAALPQGWARAAAVDANAGRGKQVLYVCNLTKLEKARAATPPPEPKRIAALQSWRDNDMKAVAFLQSLGFKVRQVDEYSSVDEARGQDLILISESVDAIDVGGKYRALPIPLITFENDLLGELGMTGWKSGHDYGTDDDQRFIFVVNAPHPLAAGLKAGVQNVLDDEHYKMNWGKPCLGAVTIATLLGEPDKAAVFAYEKGSTMYAEFLAPARRLSFFLWQDTFQGLRPEGLALFRAAVLWAVSPPE